MNGLKKVTFPPSFKQYMETVFIKVLKEGNNHLENVVM